MGHVDVYSIKYATLVYSVFPFGFKVASMGSLWTKIG